MKKGPIIIRLILFFFAFIFFVAPLIGIASAVSNKSGLKIGFILAPVLFSLMEFYLLRLALWNTYGKEIMTFKNNEMNYIADYGWFKDGRKTKQFKLPIEFTIQKTGYEEDHKGPLPVRLGDDKIQCVTIMPISELEELKQAISALLIQYSTSVSL